MDRVHVTVGPRVGRAAKQAELDGEEHHRVELASRRRLREGADLLVPAAAPAEACAARSWIGRRPLREPGLAERLADLGRAPGARPVREQR